MVKQLSQHLCKEAELKYTPAVLQSSSTVHVKPQECPSPLLRTELDIPRAIVNTRYPEGPYTLLL